MKHPEIREAQGGDVTTASDAVTSARPTRLSKAALSKIIIDTYFQADALSAAPGASTRTVDGAASVVTKCAGKPPPPSPLPITHAKNSKAELKGAECKIWLDFYMGKKLRILPMNTLINMYNRSRKKRVYHCTASTHSYQCIHGQYVGLLPT